MWWVLEAIELNQFVWSSYPFCLLTNGFDWNSILNSYLQSVVWINKNIFDVFIWWWCHSWLCLEVWLMLSTIVQCTIYTLLSSLLPQANELSVIYLRICICLQLCQCSSYMMMTLADPSLPGSTCANVCHDTIAQTLLPGFFAKKKKNEQIRCNHHHSFLWHQMRVCVCVCCF